MAVAAYLREPLRFIFVYPQEQAFTNPVTLESLASRVCRGDASLINSEQQTTSDESLVNYVTADGAGFDGNGLRTSGMCILMWIIVIARELEAISDDVLAMCRHH